MSFEIQNEHDKGTDPVVRLRQRLAPGRAEQRWGPERAKHRNPSSNFRRRKRRNI